MTMLRTLADSTGDALARRTSLKAEEIERIKLDLARDFLRAIGPPDITVAHAGARAVRSINGILDDFDTKAAAYSFTRMVEAILGETGAPPKRTMLQMIVGEDPWWKS